MNWGNGTSSPCQSFASALPTVQLCGQGLRWSLKTCHVSVGWRRIDVRDTELCSVYYLPLLLLLPLFGSVWSTTSGRCINSISWRVWFFFTISAITSVISVLLIFKLTKKKDCLRVWSAESSSNNESCTHTQTRRTEKGKKCDNMLCFGPMWEESGLPLSLVNGETSQHLGPHQIMSIGYFCRKIF